MARVVSITVTHDSAHAIDACLDALRALSVTSVVVDNASRDGTRERIAARRDADVVLLPANRGFAAANNAGRARAVTVEPDADLVLFVNPDVVVPRAALDAMIAALDAAPRAAAVVPSLRRSDGSVRAGAAPMPGLADFLLAPLGARRRRADRLARALATPGVHRLDDAYCEAGCLLARRAALDSMAGFDERFFLYFEDVDLSARLHASGFELLHAPEAVAAEAAAKGSRAPGTTSDADDLAWRRARFVESEARWFAKRSGAWAATLVRSLRRASEPLRRR